MEEIILTNTGLAGERGQEQAGLLTHFTDENTGGVRRKACCSFGRQRMSKL